MPDAPGRLESVGVGIAIAHDLLHRSGRADFPHPALTLGDDAKTAERIEMTDSRWWQPAVNQALHPVPSEHGSSGCVAKARGAIASPLVSGRCSAQRHSWAPHSSGYAHQQPREATSPLRGWDHACAAGARPPLRSASPAVVCVSCAGSIVPVHHRLFDLIRPTRRHIPTSPPGGLYGMPSLCGCA